MGVELPFTYGKPHTSPSEYYRLDPKIYSRNLYNNVPKKTKAKIEEPKVVRNVKNLPKHLIGRVHTADNVQNNMKVSNPFHDKYIKPVYNFVPFSVYMYARFR